LHPFLNTTALVVSQSFLFSSLPFPSFLDVWKWERADSKIGEKAHICITHRELLRTGDPNNARSFYDELGLSAGQGFVARDALVAVQKHLGRSGVTGDQNAESLVAQAVKAGRKSFNNGIENHVPRREALLQVYVILSDKDRREIYQKLFAPLFTESKSLARLGELCGWDV
jgi:hypothetical protein